MHSLNAMTEGTHDLYWAAGLTKTDAEHTKPEFWPGKKQTGSSIAKTSRLYFPSRNLLYSET